MKKAISILLVLVMALSLCACGGNSGSGKPADDATSKYVGTYVGYDTYYFRHMPCSQIDDRYMDSYNVSKEGKCTYTLNNDGTGNLVFVVNELLGKENVEVFNCPITWEVVDEYVYITGSCQSDYDTELIKIDKKYVLEGKDLMPGPESYYKFRKQ